MRHAWLLALAMGLLVPASAGARKECRPVAPPPTEVEDEWPHDAPNGWVHEGDSRWVHEPPAGADPEEGDAGPGWVHDADYGWWAALPEVGLRDVDSEQPVPAAEDEEELEDCTVSRERNECMVLANQLATYHFRMNLAQEREDELWEASLRQTIERLEARGESRDCPWVEPSLREKIVQTVDAVARAVIVAAQVYAKLQSMGLY
jgi:hypothetical protein